VAAGMRSGAVGNDEHGSFPHEFVIAGICNQQADSVNKTKMSQSCWMAVPPSWLQLQGSLGSKKNTPHFPEKRTKKRSSNT